jgi:hypothetical protein
MTDFIPNESWFQPSLLARDHKLFLQLSAEEADFWLPRVFDRIRPHINMINGLFLEDGEENENQPINLELVLMLAIRSVREVAQEMADSMLTPDRLDRILPVLNTYCDELLAENRALDATFIQQGLIQIKRMRNPGQNPLLVEICVRSIFHQIDLFSGNPRTALLAQ